jgi:hypothetical protein
VADGPSDEFELALDDLKSLTDKSSWFTSEVAVSSAIVRALRAHAGALEQAGRAAERHARGLVWATWALVLATVALVMVTVSR